MQPQVPRTPGPPAPISARSCSQESPPRAVSPYLGACLSLCSFYFPFLLPRQGPGFLLCFVSWFVSTIFITCNPEGSCPSICLQVLVKGWRTAVLIIPSPPASVLFPHVIWAAASLPCPMKSCCSLLVQAATPWSAHHTEDFKPGRTTNLSDPGIYQAVVH